MLAAQDVAAELMQRITACRSGGVFNGDLELVEKTLLATSANAQLIHIHTKFFNQ